MRHAVVQTARRHVQSCNSKSIARAAAVRCNVLAASPTRQCAPHAGPSRLQRRTFVSLGDLTKLSPFGSGNGGPDGDNMQRYTETVVMPFGQAEIFDVVQDVERYDEFVPYCVASRVLNKKEAAAITAKAPQMGSASTGAEARSFLAELAVGFGSFRESYTSRVTLVGQDKVIAEAIPTPLFQLLRTSWTLKPGPKTASGQPQTRIDFSVEYAFSNPLYATVAHGVMNKMAGQMMDAFRTRAAELTRKS